MALASLIRAVPKATYVDYLPTVRVRLLSIRLKHLIALFIQLMPILLRGLHLEDTELRSNIFETLLQVAKDAGDLGASNAGPLAEHAGSLVKASLFNSQSSEGMTSVRQVCFL